MKVTFVLSLILAVATAATIPSDDSSVSVITDSGELDHLTAETLERFGGVLDDADDDDDDTFGDNDPFGEEEQNDDSSSEGEVIHARVNEEGDIEVDDMIISPKMFEVMFPAVTDHPDNTDQQSVHKRAAVSSRSKMWPSGRVPYAYSSKLSGSQSKIRAAMDEWEKYTCLKFEYRKTSETKYVQFRTKVDSSGKEVSICSSSLGYIGRLQYINLAKNCFAHKTILHEIGHAIGLIHEHQHPSRDSYVTIIWDNINPAKKSNFNPKTGVSSYGLAYDPTSIMHYRSTSFKKSGCAYPCYTILSKKGSSTTRLMGTATHLSTKSDIPIVKMMYSCPASGY